MTICWKSPADQEIGLTNCLLSLIEEKQPLSEEMEEKNFLTALKVTPLELSVEAIEIF